jgi:predicted alpha/beta hydrolase
MTAQPESIQLTASDGYTIAADFYPAQGATKGAVLLAGAMGVPRGFYSAFASYLAEHGLATLTLDYRGLGESAPPALRGFQGSITDWVDHDLPTAMSELQRRVPGAPLLWIGHSIGGQIMGFMDTRHIHAALMIASQSGYWRRWHTVRWRSFMWIAGHLLLPGMASVLGYVPKQFFGENLPAGVARQWASWIRDPEYMGRLARLRNWADYRRYHKPLRLLTVSDDNYAPWRPAEGLLALYPNALKEHLGVSPADVGVNAIGHFAMFRPKFRETLWPGWRDWLLAQAALPPPKAGAA